MAHAAGGLRGGRGPGRQEPPESGEPRGTSINSHPGRAPLYPARPPEAAHAEQFSVRGRARYLVHCACGAAGRLGGAPTGGAGAHSVCRSRPRL
eukprot:3048113-Alexandrium_andersonii.AAC.1